MALEGLAGPGMSFGSGMVGGAMDFANTQMTNAFNLFKGLVGSLGFSGAAQPYLEQLHDLAANTGASGINRTDTAVKGMSGQWDRYFSKAAPGGNLPRVSLTSAGGKVGGRAGIGQQVADFALGEGPGTLGGNQQNYVTQVREGFAKLTGDFKESIGNYLQGASNAANESAVASDIDIDSKAALGGLDSIGAERLKLQNRKMIGAEVQNQGNQVRVAVSSKLADLWATGESLVANINTAIESKRAELVGVAGGLMSEGLEADRDFLATLNLKNIELNTMWTEMLNAAEQRNFGYINDAIGAQVNKDYLVMQGFLGGTGDFKKSEAGAIVASSGTQAGNQYTTWQSQPEEPEGWFS